MAAVLTQEGWGFIDEDGAFVVPLIYARVGAFYRGVTWVERFDQSHALIDATGNEFFD